jgi:outer membrane protein TolC
VRLSLEDALRAAGPASEAIISARAEAGRARAQVHVARSAWFPQVDGTASYTRTIRSEFDDITFGPTGTDGLGDLPFGQPDTWRVGVTVGQNLFDGWRTSSSVTQARAAAHVSEIAVTSVRAQVVLATAQAYFEAALADRQIAIAEATLAQTEETLRDTQLGFSQGTAPEFDVVRAQVSRDNQETVLVRLRAERDVAYVRLRRLIGGTTGSARPIVLTTRLDVDDVDAVVAAAREAAGLPARATRAPVAQAREVVELKRGALGVARSELWPQLSAFTDLGLVDYTPNPFRDADWRTNWTVGVSLSVPLFDGFRRRASVRGARAELAQARAQLADAAERADVEVVEIDAAVEAAALTLVSTTRTVAQAARAFEIATLRFQQGVSSHLELADARIQLELSQLNQAQAARDLRIARIRRELLPGLPFGTVVGEVTGAPPSGGAITRTGAAIGASATTGAP